MRDKIFLLSAREYEEYKWRIPFINTRWWTSSCSPFVYDNVIFVDENGNTHGDSYAFVADLNEQLAIRPALRVEPEADKIKVIDNNTIIYCGVTWKAIDKNLYISEMPIEFGEFHTSQANLYEDGYFDYERSDIRNFLLAWYELRKEW